MFSRNKRVFIKSRGNEKVPGEKLYVRSENFEDPTVVRTVKRKEVD